MTDPTADPTADPGPDPSPEPTPTFGHDAPPSDPGPASAPPSDPDPAPAPAPGPSIATSDRAAAVRRQNRIAALGLVAVIVVVAVGAGIAIGRAGAPSTTALEPIATAGAPAAGDSQAPATPGPAGSGTAATSPDGPRMGAADAPVTIDYWADFQCPFCARFASQVIPRLRPLIDDGTVLLVHRDDAFIGPESLDAAVAVRCAGRQGRYWPMHDAVYAAQQGENQGGFARARLEQIAAGVGLEGAAFTACLDDPAPLVDVLDDTAAAVRSGVESTPTIDVNGRRFVGVPDLPTLTAAIEAAAAGASPAPLPTARPLGGDWADTPTDGRSAGDTAAPLTVELWMDYQAPASASVPTDLEPALRARIASGGIRVVQRDLATLGDESVTAAAGVRCVAEQDGPAWLVNDVLAVSAQGPGSGIFVPRNLLQLAARLGLDVRSFAGCLGRQDVADAVRAETDSGTAAGLAAGPAVVLRNGDTEVARFTGPLDTTAILAAIDAAR